MSWCRLVLSCVVLYCLVLSCLVLSCGCLVVVLCCLVLLCLLVPCVVLACLGLAWLLALGSWLLALGSWLLALGSWLILYLYLCCIALLCPVLPCAAPCPVLTRPALSFVFCPVFLVVLTVLSFCRLDCFAKGAHLSRHQARNTDLLLDAAEVGFLEATKLLLDKPGVRVLQERLIPMSDGECVPVVAHAALLLFYMGLVTPFFREIIRCIFVTNHPLHRACVCVCVCVQVSAFP